MVLPTQWPQRVKQGFASFRALRIRIERTGLRIRAGQVLVSGLDVGQVKYSRGSHKHDG